MALSEISSKWLDEYFDKRPQLTRPARGMFGYKIDRRWFEVVHSLLNMESSQPVIEADAEKAPGKSPKDVEYLWGCKRTA